MVEIDFMARRYGVLPSEFLKLDNWEFGFNVFVAQVGTNDEARQRKRALESQTRGSMRGG